MDLINEGKPLEEVDEHLLDLKEVIGGDNDVKTLDMVVVPLNKGSVKAAADFLDKLNDALLSWRFNIVSKVFKVFTNKAPNKVKDGYALYRLDNDELNTLIVVYDIATLRDVLNELAGHSLLHIF
ncbi:hypothetical protein [Vulcanisaeta distributa]|uniref:hypothetical protein n=1 Tax=Vulcanisaeta distributa TaxID=164451 RepID=UPI0006CFADB8|nr:hypothetical protein [Vulcanisaeta distributa]